MTYITPSLRSMAAMEGQKIYGASGSLLDVSRFVTTAVPAGSRGRIIANGENLEESGNPGVPIRLVGNNTAFTFALNMKKSLIPEAMKKYVSRGINFIRHHGIEIYMMTGGPIPDGPLVNRVGDMNWAPERVDEFDYFCSMTKAAGIYYSLNPISSNLAVNLNGGDRYGNSSNTSGAFTATISGGQVTGLTLTNGGANHWFPPEIVINGDPATGGVGAKAIAVVNPSTGVITGYQLISGGRDYIVAPTVAIYGGAGNYKIRIRSCLSAKAHYAAMMNYFLNHVNAYTGIAMKDDPSCAFIESYNESHLGVLARSSMPTSLYPVWQLWLADRYGTIAALNTKWGTSFTSFCDAALAPKLIGYSPNTTAEKWHMNDSMFWMTQSDIDTYNWYYDTIRAAGWTGIITGRDMAGGSVMPKTNVGSRSGIQTYHAYPSLQDVYTVGQTMNSGGTAINAPSSFGVNPLWSCLNNLVPGLPRMWTEAGYTMPAKYRGEFGLMFGAYSSMYNFCGITLHSDTPIGTIWGATNTTTRGRGIYASAYEHDPAAAASIFLLSMMFHRRDVDVAAVDKTYVVNDKALSYYQDWASVTGTPFYLYEQSNLNTPSSNIPMCGRIETAVDPTDNATIAATWQTDILKSWPTMITEMGFSPSHEVYDWVITRGNSSQLNGAAMYVVRYTKNRQIFADQLAGIMGVNTARTQAGVCSKEFAQPNGTLVRNGGAGYASKPTRDGLAILGNSYKTNFMGNRFWQNLEINYIRDTVLLGITSFDTNPIATTNKIIVATSGNSYNNGATWQSNGNTVVSVPVTNGGSSWTAPPLIKVTGSGGANSFLGVGVLTGGVVTGVIVQNGGTGFLNVTSVPITSGGSGYTNGTFPLAFSGGPGTGVTGTYTAAGGVVTSTNITNGGWNNDATLVASIPAGNAGAGTGAVLGSPVISPIAVSAVRAASDTTGSGATFGTPVFAPDDESKEIKLLQPYLSDKGIGSVPITAGGSGYTNGTFPLTIAGVGGTGAAGTYTVVGGVVVSTAMTASGSLYTAGGTASIPPGNAGAGSGAVLGTPLLIDREGWPIQTLRHVVDFNITGVDNTVPWAMYELDYAGNRLASYPVRKIATGINVRIDSSKTVQPSVFFELVKGEISRKPRP